MSQLRFHDDALTLRHLQRRGKLSISNPFTKIISLYESNEVVSVAQILFVYDVYNETETNIAG
jgi:hypothetical protein